MVILIHKAIILNRENYYNCRYHNDKGASSPCLSHWSWCVGSQTSNWGKPCWGGHCRCHPSVITEVTFDLVIVIIGMFIMVLILPQHIILYKGFSKRDSRRKVRTKQCLAPGGCLSQVFTIITPHPTNIWSSMLSVSSSTDIDCQRNNHEHDYLVMMVIMTRHGHKCAAINPVALEEPKPVPELDPARSSSYPIFVTKGSPHEKKNVFFRQKRRFSAYYRTK